MGQLDSFNLYSPHHDSQRPLRAEPIPLAHLEHHLRRARGDGLHRGVVSHHLNVAVQVELERKC
jgi:hypothetical protein